MNGNLPAVVRAMILASLPLCALLAACGNNGDDTTSIDFDHALAERQGFAIATAPPSPTGILDAEEALTSLGSGRPDVRRTELVQLTVSNYPGRTRLVTGDFLAWALDLDLEDIQPFLDTAECNGPGFGGGDAVVLRAIAFVDARQGRCLGFLGAVSSAGD